MIRWICLLLTTLILHWTPVVGAESEQKPVQFVMMPEEESVQAGKPFWVALQINIADGWHVYWKNPGEIGMPLEVNFTLPENFKVAAVDWPVPERFDADSSFGFGYKGPITLLAQIVPSEPLPDSNSLKISSSLVYVACSDSMCLPGNNEASLELPLLASAPQVNASHTNSFTEARSKVPNKEARVEAFKNQSLLELHVRLPEEVDQHFVSARFFPEIPQSVDEKTEPVLISHSSEPNHYQLILKAANSDIETLKGIVVLEAEDGTKHACDVEAALQRREDDFSADTLVGMAEEAPAVPVQDQHMDPKPESDSIAMAIVLAFLGGMILNLMPCVLPVVSFKVLSFVKMAGKCRKLTLKHGLMFAAGVLASFWVLAGILLILQTYGRSVGWGFQLQEPLFVGILASFLLVFALSLFGIFEIGNILVAWAGQAQRAPKSDEEGLSSSFFSGILATAVATPCTGPFLGSAIGFAVTLPPHWALLIFTSLGLGMSAPYLLLSAYPNLLRFLPKPGKWMDTFKEIVGFIMLATVLWLVWVFGAQTSELAIIMLLAAFFLFTIGCWVYGRWGSPVCKKSMRIVSYVFALICFVAGGGLLMDAVEKQNNRETAQIADNWEPFSAERVEELRKQGIPVVIDFTAKWCLICQANHYSLSNDTVNKKMNELGVVKMKADWTKNDPAITQELRRWGRNGVPLYLMYGSNENEPPQILPQVLTTDIVMNSLENVK